MICIDIVSSLLRLSINIQLPLETSRQYQPSLVLASHPSAAQTKQTKLSPSSLSFELGYGR